jgi:hypothetical protein
MAKKKKNRPEGFDPNERKRERIEARRQAKAEALARQRKAQRRERIVRRTGIVVLAVFVVWFLFIRGAAPDEIAGYEVEHYSTSAGNPTHVDGDVAYEMSPPVSGQHNLSTVPCGTFGSPIDDEVLVHDLEHGAVAVLYEPALPVAQIRQIEELVRGYESHTISAPFEGEMETPIAVVAWAHIMRLPELDEGAVTEFIDEFRAGGDAPEAYQECPNEADEEFEPAGATPAPGEASPGASPPPASQPPTTRRPGRGTAEPEETEAP